MLRKHFPTLPWKVRNKKEIIVVSGLPRSGTSMMMQMLFAGGMMVVTDSIRKPDQNNPRGYFEFEEVKNIENDKAWLDSCHGKAFKMISALLCYLPDNKRFKIIFMLRDISEVLSSQKLMLENLDAPDNAEDEKLEYKFSNHLDDITQWLKTQKNMEVKYVNYNDIIQNSEKGAQEINAFLGGHLDPVRMAEVVDESLYHQKIN